MDGFDLKPMSVADLFDRCFVLFARSWKQLLALGALVAGPASVLVWLLFRSSFSTMGDWIPDGSADPEQYMQVGKSMFWILIAGLVMVATETLLLSSFALVYCGKTVGKDYETDEIFALAFSARGARAVAQRLLGEFITALVIIVPYFLAILMAVAVGVLGAVLGFLVFIAGFGLWAYLRVRWAFGLTAIVWEDDGVADAFERSSKLFTIAQARTFFIMLMFSIGLGFALYMVTLPIQTFAMADLTRAYLELMSNPVQSGADFSAVFDAMGAIGPLFAVAIAVRLMFKTIVQSAYHSSLYFDLRARRGEFDQVQENSVDAE